MAVRYLCVGEREFVANMLVLAKGWMFRVDFRSKQPLQMRVAVWGWGFTVCELELNLVDGRCVSIIGIVS